MSHQPAAARCEFQLTYNRADEKRTFLPGKITGPDIPDAYGEDTTYDGTSDGAWFAEPPPKAHRAFLTENDWISHFASMAIHEGVHEVLEWFQVDGVPWLDPHDRDQQEIIYSLIEELVAGLTQIRKASVRT